MKHFLSKKNKEDEIEIVTLDVSFILTYLNKIIKAIPSEIMLLKFYHLRAKGDDNTVYRYREFIKDKVKADNDLELYTLISRKRYTKTVLKIKNTIDSLIFREFGCEVLDARFIDYVVATDKEVKIKIEIKR